MPRDRDTAHRIVSDTALPYETFNNPIGETLAIESGQNVLTSLKGFMERFPGFDDALETTATSFTNLKRIFLWRRWGGPFVAMFNDIIPGIPVGQSRVYKYEIGVDTSAVLIHTATGTEEPFDFVSANDWCFFGNGTTQANMRKWRSGSTSFLWGIASPTVVPTVTVTGSGDTGTLIPSAAAGTNWTNPTFALASDGSYAVFNTTTQNYLALTGATTAIPSGASIAGVAVSIEGNGTDAAAANRMIQVGLTTDGTTLAGNLKSITLNQTTDTTTTLGGNTDTWGATLTEALVEGSTFGVLIRDADATGAALNIDYVTWRIYYSTTSTLDAAVGHAYRYTYGNSATGHQSSVSDASACTGTFTDSSVGVGVTASSDPQVNEIHVYRNTDGGSEDPVLMQELPNSPFANATATITDTTDDADLAGVFAPGLLRNDPPPPSRGFCYSTTFKRIFMFRDNRVDFTGYEEIGTGVPEESVPGGLDGNFEVFGAEITAIADGNGGVAIFTPQTIYGIEGDSLDTFRRYKLMDRRGTRSRQTVGSLGGDIYWLDTSNTVWVASLGEVGLPIRPDLKALDPERTWITPHISGEFHWLVVGDGANGQLLVFDLDRQQWMPPRVIGTTLGPVVSGETAAGVVDLVMARNRTKALKLTADSYQDDGSPYAAFAELSLADIHGEGKPSWRGILDWAELEYAGQKPSMGILVDDDPAGAAAHSAMSEVSASDLDLAQGTTLQVTRYRANPEVGKAGRRASLRFDWSAADQNFKLYTIDMVSHPTP